MKKKLKKWLRPVLFTPVSYTHLDVYKRQVLLRNRELLFGFHIDLAGLSKYGMPQIDTVSQDALDRGVDVYKRQVVPDEQQDRINAPARPLHSQIEVRRLRVLHVAHMLPAEQGQWVCGVQRQQRCV